MERQNHQECAHEDLSSLSEAISSFSLVDQNELNSLKDIFEDHSSPEKERYTSDRNNNDAKRKRSVDYHMTKEKKRRKIFKDKLDILMRLIPVVPFKSDIASKLKLVIEYVIFLKLKYNLMVMEYIVCTGHAPPFYGAEAPYISPYTTPWDYYPPGVLVMPQQNIPFTPEFHQAHDTAQPDQTNPYYEL